MTLWLFAFLIWSSQSTGHQRVGGTLVCSRYATSATPSGSQEDSFRSDLRGPHSSQTRELLANARPLCTSSGQLGTAGDGSDATKFWVPIVSALAVLVASVASPFVALRSANRAYASAERSLLQRANEEELSRLEKSLDDFYGPFLHLSQASYYLASDFKSRMPETGLRMLLSLIRAGWYESLPVGDQVIVREVCENGARQEKLIVEHAGVVDDILREYLGRATIHFRMLNRAFNKELGADEKAFEIYVFPEHLTEVLEWKVTIIKARCEFLRSHLAEKVPAPEPFSIPADWNLRPWPNPKPPRRQGQAT